MKNPTPDTRKDTRCFDSAAGESWPFLRTHDDLRIEKGRSLPHWSQSDVWYFVTFRLHDSIPAAMHDKIREERESWLNRRKFDDLSLKERIEYHRLFSARYDAILKSGYGECILRDEKNAEIVKTALLFFDQKRYLIDEYAIMPNHVHVLVKPFFEHPLSKTLHSWKSFTAHQINRRMNRSGPVWQKESYDHIVRSPEAFARIQQYIRQNPNPPPPF